MKTNILFVCQYCDKKLGSKRTVRMHISNRHNADPDNPVMYEEIFVSPRDVKKLLKGLSPNPEGEGKIKVMNLGPEKVRDDGQEHIINVDTVKVINVVPEKVINVVPDKVINVESEKVTTSPFPRYKETKKG
jgi:hypothetical protein